MQLLCERTIELKPQQSGHFGAPENQKSIRKYS